MLDKVHLYTNDFQPLPRAKFEIEPCKIDNVTGEVINEQILWYEGKTPKIGRKAYNNDYGANITIKNGLLSVYYNPSTMMLGNNFHPTSHKQIAQSIDNIKNAFTEIGIKANVDTCKLSRIDLCRNMETDYNLDIYKPALDLITPKWMPETDPTIKSGYWLKANRSLAFCLYDKLGQVISEKIDPLSLGIQSPNVTRNELRLVNHRTIKNLLSIESVNELNTQEHFHHRLDVYKQIQTDRFFRIKDFDRTLRTHEDDRDMLCALREQYPNKAVELFVMHRQMTGQHDPLTIDYITRLMTDFYAKSTIADKKNTLIDMLQFRIDTANKPQILVPYVDLLNELYLKSVA